MHQDERTITQNNETGEENGWLRLKIIVKNTSNYSFKVFEDLKHGELTIFEPVGPCDNNEFDSEKGKLIGICEKKKDTIIVYQRLRGFGPQGALFLKSKENSKFYFKLYFDLSRIPTNPRCTYIYQGGDYSMVTPIFCFPTEGDDSEYVVEYSISDPVLCNNFYHVTDTHFSDGLEDKEYANKFNYAHKCLFDRINSDDQSLGLIHTGDVCYEDEHFSDYQKYYLKAPNVRDDFKPKYLKNLYEGYGNHDKSDVIKSIHNRLENGRENTSYDQCICEINKDLINPYHYYWYWHGVCFIHLNLAPIDGKDKSGNDAKEALTYLKDVLKILGDQKPVILCFHYLIAYEFQDNPEVEFLTAQQKKDFWDVIKDYNICAILCGHIHNIFSSYRFSFIFNNEKYVTNIPCYSAGTMKPDYYGSKEAYKSTYYRFEFDDEKKKIKAYKNEITFLAEPVPQTSEYNMLGGIDITAGKKPKCDITPESAKKD